MVEAAETVSYYYIIRKKKKKGKKKKKKERESIHCTTKYSLKICMSVLPYITVIVTYFSVICLINHLKHILIQL